LKYHDNWVKPHFCTSCLALTWGRISREALPPSVSLRLCFGIQLRAKLASVLPKGEKKLARAHELHSGVLVYGS
jgi:hypothetical protein